VERYCGNPKAGDDAVDTRFFPLNNLPFLAFDHENILREWRRNGTVKS
jgi:8-oxo-dGTP diphosphatase